MKRTTISKVKMGAGVFQWRISLVLLLIMLASTVFAQGFDQKYNVYLYGQVLDEASGAPIGGQEILIVSDTGNVPGNVYSNTVYTDHEGFFYDTVTTNLEKGHLYIITYDYISQKYVDVVHYRFMWDENNILFSNFMLPVETVSSSVQANFFFQRNPSGTNNLEYYFYDVTNATSISSWQWDFGDGTYSNEQNPTHTFSEGGLYKVVLTVSVNQNGTSYLSSISKFINVAEENYFHMGGHIFAGSFPIDISEVFLYKIDNDDLIPIDTALFNDTLGYYLFYQLIEGEYIVKADLHPSSELFNDFITTYYSDKLHWAEADTIFHHTSYYEYDISLAPKTQASYGPGSISGEITYDPGYSGGGKSAPAENVAIILYDEFDEPTTICHSNETGQFMLDDLDIQKYYVYAEVTGKYTIPVEVQLEESANGNQIVQIVISDEYVSGMVNSGIQNNELNAGLSDVYPNPVSHSLHISYSGQQSGQLTYTLLNYEGQVIESGNLNNASGKNTMHVNVDHLTEGMYFIRIMDSAQHSASRKFIKK